MPVRGIAVRGDRTRYAARSVDNVPAAGRGCGRVSSCRGQSCRRGWGRTSRSPALGARACHAVACAPPISRRSSMERGRSAPSRDSTAVTRSTRGVTRSSGFTSALGSIRPSCRRTRSSVTSRQLLSGMRLFRRGCSRRWRAAGLRPPRSMLRCSTSACRGHRGRFAVRVSSAMRCVPSLRRCVDIPHPVLRSQAPRRRG